MTKIGLHSDLHLELQNPPMYWLEFTPDILVLAGDIHKIDTLSQILPMLSENRPEMDIVLICGNHEYYGCSDITRAEKDLRHALSEHNRIHFLQCDSKVIQGVRFIGCTGWTTLNSLKQEDFPNIEEVVSERINDFYHIGMKSHKFNTQDCIQLGQQHFDWLEQQLIAAKEEPAPSIVVTHFAPSLRYRNKKHEIDEYTAYFCNEYIDLLKSYTPDYWLFGHTHFNVNESLGNTRIISNQKGYGKECADYQPNFIFEI